MGAKRKQNPKQSSEELCQEIDIESSLQELARVGGWEIAKGQSCLSVSSGFCRLFDLKPTTELSLAEFAQLYTEHDKDRFDRYLQACLGMGCGFTEDFKMCPQTGESLWVKVNAKPVFDPKGNVVKAVGSVQDITQTKLQLLQMKEERNLLKLAIDISKLGIWSSDDANNINFDNRMREIYGFKEGEQTTVEAVQSKIYHEDRDRLSQLSQESAEKNKSMRFNYRVVHEGDEIRHIEGYLLPQFDPATSKFKRFIGVNKDISEKVKGDEANKRLLEILDSTTDFIGYASVQEEIGYMNRAFSGLWNDTKPAGINHLHPSWANKIINEEGIPAAIKNGTWTGESAVLTFDGQEIPVSQVIICHYDKKNKPIYFSTIMRDIRDTKKMLAALQRQKLESEVAARSKANFLANMSHEIRTPMNGILGFVELLKEEISDPNVDEKLEVIRSSGELLLSIVDDILDFSKIDAGKLSLEEVEFSPLNLVQDVKKLFESKRIQNTNLIKLSIDERFHNGPLLGDPNRFKQLLFNLVGNACKFTKNGDVTIGVASIYKDEKNIKIIVTVSDTGIGIAADRISHLFKSFSQADETTTRRFGGTGLGLSICKSIVEAWEGSISVQSVEGKGSSFKFVLPLKISSKQQLASAQALKHQQFPGLRVLVAEDNQVNLAVTQKLLAKLSIEVVSVVNGQEAVLACQQDQFQIVFMDCHMPVMDGFEATKKILRRDLGTKAPIIIALTAGVLEEEVERCRKVGMVDVLFKPVSLEQLADIIMKHASEFAAPDKKLA